MYNLSAQKMSLIIQDLCIVQIIALFNDLFVLFVCYLIVMFVKNHVPRGFLIIPIILQCPMESNNICNIVYAIP